MARATIPGRLLALLHQEGTVTRAEATARLGKARSAVGEAVGELVELGLVTIGAEANSPQRTSAGRGRTSPLLELAPDGPIVIAVHLHPAGADLAVFGLGGRHGPVERMALRWNSADFEDSLEVLAQRVTRKVGGRRCLGVGVGVAGIVSADARRVLSGLYLGWADAPVAAVLESALPAGLAVSVHKDAALAGLAEFRRGAGRGAATLLTLSCEHLGIGGAMLTTAGLVDGPRHALEVGHLVLDPYGPPCPCGQRGCLELYCDGRALAASLADGESDSREIVRRARAGDAAAHRAVRDVANRLGTGLTGLVNVLTPDRVVLTGLLADYLDLAGADLRQHLAISLVGRLHGTRLVAATVPDPVLTGAAELVLDAVLDDPAGAMKSCSQ